MTQPTSVNMTFDTSLVDLKPDTSFSTTESDLSDFGTSNPTSKSTTKTSTLQHLSVLEHQSQDTPTQFETLPKKSTAPNPKMPTLAQHIPTQEAYDQWAEVYDLDGNMLQSIDDLELSTLLPDFLSQVRDTSTSPSDISVLDLGCGTGRNTAKLLAHHWPKDTTVTITGLDFSRGMLSIAEQKLRPLLSGNAKLSLRLECCDCFPTATTPSASPLPVSDLPPANVVINTLVLEHIPLTPFFATLSALLAPSGLALITNMHADMGCVSQAGFVNKEGVKVRGTSFAHTVQETVNEAQRQGFEVVSVREREMRGNDVQSGKVGERGWKWVGVKVWFGVVVRRVR